MGGIQIVRVRSSDRFIEEIDKDKIINAIIDDARFACKIFRHDSPMMIDSDLAKKIASRVISQIKKMDFGEDDIITSDTIRGLVTTELYKAGENEIAHVSEIVGMRTSEIYDLTNGSNFHDNANLQSNDETVHKQKADEISKKYYLKILPEHITRAHISGDLHIHDLEYFGTRSFCQDWDLRYFFYYGLMPDGVGTKASVSGPAMNPEVAVLHAVKALGAAQTNFAGGQGFYNFLVFLAPYFEGLSYKEIKQCMQMFVYEMTQMMVARGGQVVFSSVQLTPGVPELWGDRPIVYKGYIWDGGDDPNLDCRGRRTYGEFEREVRLSFKALMEVMLEGDDWGKPFMFPKPEIAIEPEFIDEDWNEDLFEEDEFYHDMNWKAPSYKDLYLLAFQLVAKFGTPYFDNMIPSYRGHSKGGIACYQCCAYNFAIDPLTDHDFENKMNFKDGAHFSMGSHQVVTINCPRASYQSSKTAFLLMPDNPNGEYRDIIEDTISILKDRMDLACRIFLIKRDMLKPLIEAGRVPFATQRPRDPITMQPGTMASDLDSMVWTIGVVGINEMVETLTGSQLHTSEENVQLAERIMSELKMYCYELGERHEMKIALARTPAETVAQRFAVCDLLDDRYREFAKKVAKGDIDRAIEMCKNGEKNLPIYYTNGCMVPVNAHIRLEDRLAIESRFFPLVDGGNIAHIFVEDVDPFAYREGGEVLMKFAIDLFRNSDIGYLAFSPVLTVCSDCAKTSSGDLKECSFCGSNQIKHLERITGYYSQRESWNEAKQQESRDRHRYKMSG